MLRVVWKGVYDNRKNFLAFFASLIITISMIFVLMYIQGAMKFAGGIETEALAFAYQSELPRLLMVLVFAFILIAIVVSAYSVRFYIQSRMKDYGMLMVFGMRRQDMRKMIVAEYGLSCSISFLCGLFLGKLFTVGLRKVFIECIGCEFADQIDMSKVYMFTILLCVVMLCGVLFAVGIMASENALGENIKKDKEEDERMISKRSYVFLGAGCLLVAGSILMAYKSPEASVFAVLILCGGLALIICAGTGRFWEKFKNSPRYVYDILAWDRFYYRFKRQKFRILVQTMIGVLVVYFSFLMIKAMAYPRLMPNDFACISENGQGEEAAEHMKNEYMADIGSFPFVWVNAYNGDTRIGMALSDYNRVFGGNEQLEKDEIINIWRIEGTDDASLDCSGGKEEKNLYLGQSMNVSTEDVEYEYNFRVKKEEKKELIGFSMVGVTVLSDELFKEAAEKSNFHQQFYLFNVENAEMLENAGKYIEMQKEKGIFKEAFCREAIEEIDRKQQILSYMIVGVMGVAVLFYCMFIIWLTMLAELPELEEKYRFLDVSGMRKEAQKKTLHRENKRIVCVPVMLTMISGTFFCSAMIGGYYDKTGPFAETMAWIVLAIVLVTYLVLEVIFMQGSGYWLSKRTLLQE